MLWIGDIGDNRAVRTSVVLRLLREPAPIRSTTVTPVDLRVRYPDGPTDADGAFIDAAVAARVRALNLDPADFLARNDAYTFFEAVGGLIRTGPTHTNVCDVRVIVASREP